LHSNDYKKLKRDINSEKEEPEPLPDHQKDDKRFFHSYPISLAEQFVLHVPRFWSLYYRSPLEFSGNVVRGVLLAAVIGLVYIKMPTDHWGAFMRLNVLFDSGMFSFFLSFGLISRVFYVKVVYMKERSAKLYNGIMFYFAHLLVDIPGIMFNIFLSSSIIYVLSGLRGTAGHYFFYLLDNIVYALLLSAFAQVVALISPSPGVADLIYGLFFSLMILTAGFLLPHIYMPNWFSWFYWLSFVHYYLEAAVINEMMGLHFSCPNNQRAIPIEFVTRETNQTVTQYYCPFQTGEQLVHLFSFNPSMMWPNIAILLSFYLGMLILGAFLLRYLHVQKR